MLSAKNLTKFRGILLALVVATGAFGCSADDSENQAPVINLDTSSEVSVFVGDELRVIARAQDPEGGKVNYDWQVRPTDRFSVSSADFFESDTEALFVWAPIASDVTDPDEPMRLIIIATDPAGKVTEKTVNVTVLAGNGVPRFLNNQSELYDPRVGKPLVVNVRVRDDDSNEVELTMDESSAPPGSSIEQIGPFEATFEWQPTVEQLQRRVHSVTFVADDDQNDPVEFVVTIVIRSRSVSDIKAEALDLSCPGEEVIEHSQLTAARTFDAYEVEARLTAAAEDKYDKITAYFTGANPYQATCDEPDANGQCFESIELMKGDDGVFRGSYGNQVDVYNTVYYQLCAIAKAGSSADAVVCTPSAGEFELYYSFAVISPDEEAECADDFYDGGAGNNDFSTATQLSADDFSFYRTCSGDDDYHALRVRPGDSYFIAVIYPDESDIVVEAFDPDQNALDVEASSCTGLSGVEVSTPENGTEQTFYIKVTGGDEIAYQVRPVKTQGGEGGCADDAIEPNDTPVDIATQDAVESGAMISAEICVPGEVDLYKFDLNAGDNLSVTTQFMNQLGNLDMELFAPSQADVAGKDGVGNGVAFTFSFDDEETLEHTATETGTYYLMVFNNEETTNAYMLSASIDAAPPCPDTDMYSTGAGNHQQGDAAIIMATDTLELTGLTICPGQADWYQRTEFSGALVLGEIEASSGSLSDLSVEVVNLAGDTLATGVISGTSLDFDFTPASSGPVFYKVLSSSQLTYSMLLIR